MGLKKQRGNAFGFILILSLVGGLFAFIFQFFSESIPTGGPVPYVFVSVFIFPIATIWPLIKDVTELQEINSITLTERRRLNAMILNIQRYLKASALLLLIFGVTTGWALYLVVVNALDAKLALGVIGFFVGCSIYIVFFLINLRIKAQNYRAKVVRRIEELKQQKALIRNLKENK